MATIDLLIGAAIGFGADIARRIIVPTSSDWLTSLFPHKKKSKQREENLFYLQLLERLTKLGINPDNVDIESDTKSFIKSLRYKEDAFVENQQMRINSSFKTQTEMNIEAHQEAKISDSQVNNLITILANECYLEDIEKKNLKKSQNAWEVFREAEADFAASMFHGGSMAPLIYSKAYEAVTIDRLGQLKETYGELLETRVV